MNKSIPLKILITLIVFTCAKLNALSGGTLCFKSNSVLVNSLVMNDSATSSLALPVSWVYSGVVGTAIAIRDTVSMTEVHKSRVQNSYSISQIAGICDNITGGKWTNAWAWTAMGHTTALADTHVWYGDQAECLDKGMISSCRAVRSQFTATSFSSSIDLALFDSFVCFNSDPLTYPKMVAFSKDDNVVKSSVPSGGGCNKSFANVIHINK